MTVKNVIMYISQCTNIVLVIIFVCLVYEYRYPLEAMVKMGGSPTVVGDAALVICKTSPIIALGMIVMMNIVPMHLRRKGRLISGEEIDVYGLLIIEMAIIVGCMAIVVFGVLQNL
jgi:hypothetical protein